jgi:RNA polymerase sigma factor (sigma-70 family)
MTTLTAPSTIGVSDSSLLAAFAQRRDERAFAELVRRHGGMVLSVCRSVLGHAADAEEAGQAVFLTLAQKADSPAVQTHLVGWLHRVAWYIAARAVTRRTNRRRHEREAARMRTETEPSPVVSFDIEAVHAVLSKLPEKYRAALILHHLEGRSHEETAAIAGCSVTAVAVRLHRGREMLRNRLTRRGVATASAAILAGHWGSSAMAEVPAAFATDTAGAAAAVLREPHAVSATARSLADDALKMLFRARLFTLATALLIAVLIVGGLVITLMATGKPAPMSGPPAPLATPAKAQLPPAVPEPPPGVPAVTGQLARVTSASLDIKRQDGTTETARLDDATVVIVDNGLATAAALKDGMDAAVFVNAGQPALQVRAYSPGALAP